MADGLPAKEPLAFQTSQHDVSKRNMTDYDSKPGSFDRELLAIRSKRISGRAKKFEACSGAEPLGAAFIPR